MLALKSTVKSLSETKQQCQLFSFSYRANLIKESHAPSLAQIALEQDRNYQQLAELRSVCDVMEEVLQKATPFQLQSAYKVQ